MKHFLLGALSAVVLALVVGLLVLSSGIVSASALWDGGAIDDLLAYASRRSIAYHAKDESNPFAGDQAALAMGLDHYKANCLYCHAAPGLGISEFAEGLNPPPPKLTTPRIREMSDGELFWVVSNGIRMTGMPAFSPTHGDEEIWKIVAFVRQLSQLTDAEKARLTEGSTNEAGHHDGPGVDGAESSDSEQDGHKQEGMSHNEQGSHEQGADSRAAKKPEQSTGAGHDSHSDQQAQATPADTNGGHKEEGVSHKDGGHEDAAGSGAAKKPEQSAGAGHGSHSDKHAQAAPAAANEAPDQEIIRVQKPSYPLKTCIISGDELGVDGDPIDYVVEGRLVRVCCKACKKDVDKDPAATFKRIDAAVIAVQGPGYPMSSDPVTGEKLGDGAVTYVHGTRLVRFANKDSIALFLKDPRAHMGQVDKALIEIQRPNYPLTTCVVTAKALGGEKGEPIDYLYGTRLVRFCCKECPPKFEKDPAPYLKKLDQAAKEKAK